MFKNFFLNVNEDVPRVVSQVSVKLVKLCVSVLSAGSNISVPSSEFNVYTRGFSAP